MISCAGDLQRSICQTEQSLRFEAVTRNRQGALYLFSLGQGNIFGIWETEQRNILLFERTQQWLSLWLNGGGHLQTETATTITIKKQKYHHGEKDTIQKKKIILAMSWYDSINLTPNFKNNNDNKNCSVHRVAGYHNTHATKLKYLFTPECFKKSEIVCRSTAHISRPQWGALGCIYPSNQCPSQGIGVPSPYGCSWTAGKLLQGAGEHHRSPTLRDTRCTPAHPHQARQLDWQ